MNSTDLLPEIYLTRHQENIYPWLQTNLRTPFWRCYWNVTEGGCLRLGNEVLRLCTDRVYIIPGYFKFSTFAERPFEQFYIHFALPDRQFAPDCGILTAPVLPHWRALWKEWKKYENDPPRFRFRQMLTAQAILSEALLQHPAERMTPEQEPDARIAPALNWLKEHLDAPASNGELAVLCGLELRAFLRRFKAETGESPQQYSSRIRIEEACRLLTYTALSVEEIAERTGFPDRYYFSRVFRKQQRFPPVKFRNGQRRL